MSQKGQWKTYSTKYKQKIAQINLALNLDTLLLKKMWEMDYLRIYSTIAKLKIVQIK